jgi:hypothetical protein
VVARAGLSKVQARWVCRVVDRARASHEYQSIPPADLKLPAKDLLTRLLCISPTEAESCRRALGGPSTGSQLVRDVDDLVDLLRSPAFTALPESQRNAVIQAIPKQAARPAVHPPCPWLAPPCPVAVAVAVAPSPHPRPPRQLTGT